MLTARCQQENQRLYNLAVMDAQRKGRPVGLVVLAAEVFAWDDSVGSPIRLDVWPDGSVTPDIALERRAGIVRRAMGPRYNDPNKRK